MRVSGQRVEAEKSFFGGGVYFFCSSFFYFSNSFLNTPSFLSLYIYMIYIIYIFIYIRITNRAGGRAALYPPARRRQHASFNLPPRSPRRIRAPAAVAQSNARSRCPALTPNRACMNYIYILFYIKIHSLCHRLTSLILLHITLLF